jgi:hypothetical protein
MKKIPIESSTLKNISYDMQKRELIVEFVRGAIYKYFCVDYIDVLMLLFTESAGSYFNKHIAKTYRYEKIEG